MTSSGNPSARPARDRWLTWGPAAALALAWGVGPAVPALMDGALLGHGQTDLYPSVWGLWWFAGAQPGLPTFTEQLHFPEGMGFYYSSPIKGWLGWPLLQVLPLVTTWNLLTLAARMATVLCATLAARAWGLSPAGAFAAAATFGCAPFFHGYAVEGIVEGTDGWTLALLIAALGARRHALGAGALALTIASSWYLGAVGCLLVALGGLRDRRAWWALSGVALAGPLIVAFTDALPPRAPLTPELLEAMGAQLTIPRPGLTAGLNPFAKNTYVGWIVAAATIASLRRDPRWALLALIPGVLSLGTGPWYSLPVFDQLRFPYRWHAGTLALLAGAVGLVSARPRFGYAIGTLIALEGLLLSPVEPVIPGADPTPNPVYAQVDGPVLDFPGPVSMAPGRHNPSRLRARYLLYAQTAHGQPSPWRPDFNGVTPGQSEPWLDALQTWDRLAETPRRPLPADFLTEADRRGIRWIVLHERSHGGAFARDLIAALKEQDARVIDHQDRTWLLAVPRR